MNRICVKKKFQNIVDRKQKSINGEKQAKTFKKDPEDSQIVHGFTNAGEKTLLIWPKNERLRAN